MILNGPTSHWHPEAGAGEAKAFAQKMGDGLDCRPPSGDFGAVVVFLVLAGGGVLGGVSAIAFGSPPATGLHASRAERDTVIW